MNATKSISNHCFTSFMSFLSFLAIQGHQTGAPRMPGYHPTQQQPGQPRPPMGPNGDLSKDGGGSESDRSAASTPTPGGGAVTPKPGAAATAGAGESAYQAKLKPGKLVVCRNCGCVGADFNLCVRCKKKIGDDFKVIDDGSKKVRKKVKNVHVVAQEQQQKSCSGGHEIESRLRVTVL